MAAQMQLLQNLTATVANMQAQQNQQAPHAAPQPRDKHRDFMSHHPPTYSHSVDPLDADDWLKIISKKLDITQCTDRERVLYASGRLEGSAADWWDAYTAAHADANTITWEEFRNSFREHHIPAGVIKLKQKEFLALKQGSTSVSEYRDKFTQLSRYAPNDVDTDAKRQNRFLDGLIGPLNYQLQSHTFPNFQTLLDKAIGLESKRKERGEQKGKFQSQGQSSSNTRPATALRRVFRLVLEDKVETISRINRVSAPSSNRSITISRLSAHLVSNRIVRATHQEHQSGTTTQFNPMAASSVAKWDIMPTIAPSAMCIPPKTRGTVDRDRINNNHSSSRRPEITTKLHRVTKDSRITFVEE